MSNYMRGAILLMAGVTSGFTQQIGSKCRYGWETVTKTGGFCSTKTKPGSFFDGACSSCDVRWSVRGDPSKADEFNASYNTGNLPYGVGCCPSNSLPGGELLANILWTATTPGGDPSYEAFRPAIVGASEYLDLEGAQRQLTYEHVKLCMENPYRAWGIQMKVAYDSVRVPCYPLGDPTILHLLQTGDLNLDLEIKPGESIASTLVNNFQIAPLFAGLAVTSYASATMNHVYDLYCNMTKSEAESKIALPHSLPLVLNPFTETVMVSPLAGDLKSGLEAYVSQFQWKWGKRADTLYPKYILLDQADVFHPDTPAVIKQWPILSTPKRGSASAADIIALVEAAYALVAIGKGWENDDVYPAVPWFTNFADEVAARPGYLTAYAAWEAAGGWASGAGPPTERGIFRFPYIYAWTTVFQLFAPTLDASSSMIDDYGNTLTIGMTMEQIVGKYIGTRVFGHPHDAPYSAFAESHVFFDAKEYVTFEDAGASLSPSKTGDEFHTLYMSKNATAFDAGCTVTSGESSSTPMKPCLPLNYEPVTYVDEKPEHAPNFICMFTRAQKEKIDSIPVEFLYYANLLGVKYLSELPCQDLKGTCVYDADGRSTTVAACKDPCMISVEMPVADGGDPTACDPSASRRKMSVTQAKRKLLGKLKFF
jgi:hypothetical protein